MDRLFFILICFFLSFSLKAQEIEVSLDSKFFDEIKSAIPGEIRVRNLPKGVSLTPVKVYNIENLQFLAPNAIIFKVSLKAKISYYRKLFRLKIRKSPREIRGTFSIRGTLSLNRDKSSISIHPQIQTGIIFRRGNRFFDAFYPHIEKLIFQNINHHLSPKSFVVSKDLYIKLLGQRKKIGKLRLRRFQIKNNRIFFYLGLENFSTSQNLSLKITGKNFSLGAHRLFLNAFKEKYFLEYLRKVRPLGLPITLHKVKLLSFQKNSRIEFEITEKYSPTQSLTTRFEIFLSCQKNKIFVRNLRMTDAKATYPLNKLEKQMMLQAKFLEEPLEILPKINPVSISRKIRLQFFISNLSFSQNMVWLLGHFQVEEIR